MLRALSAFRRILIKNAVQASAAKALKIKGNKAEPKRFEPVRNSLPVIEQQGHFMIRHFNAGNIIMDSDAHRPYAD
jgi:hypothetical protein